jgi:hypothetical protein
MVAEHWQGEVGRLVLEAAITGQPQGQIVPRRRASDWAGSAGARAQADGA